MKRKGPWSREQADRFLLEARIPIRVACNGASGHPVLASLWFVPEGGALWCATQRSADVASILARDPRCAFEVSVETPPYFGVRGSGRARLVDARGDEMLRLLLERYLGDTSSKLARLLLAKTATETAIAIEPESIVSWDYRDRMDGTR